LKVVSPYSDYQLAFTGLLKPSQKTFLPKRSVILSKVNSEVRKPLEQQSNVLSEAYKSPLKTCGRSEEYNIPSNQDKGLNRANFITLRKIPKDEQIEIIKSGFQLQAEGKISLRKYYESTDPNSLFQSKGYSIKYESIRRTKFYQQLKP